jgi:hyperosmotically inducible protein
MKTMFIATLLATAVSSSFAAAPTAAAVDKCAQIAGQPNTGCLIDNRTAADNAADKTRNAATTVVEKTKEIASTAVDKTRNAATTVVEKTKEIASTAVDKTRNAAAVVAGKTERATEKVEDKSAVAADKTGAVLADSVITTKVKADIFKEPELKSMAIHVETDKGVVMLSGFVDTKADADKALRLAKGVEGVTTVKSAIKVK